MLAIVAFAALGVRYFGMVFTTSTRWAFLAFLIAVLIPGGQIFSGLKNGYGIILAGYFIWCLMTAVWSEVPTLSLLKSTALMLTALALLSGGTYWATRFPDKTLAFLAPITGLALIAALGGSASQVVNANYSVYSGLTNNSNFFGMLVAFSFPYVIYQVYQIIRAPRSRAKSILVAAACAILCFALWRSGSRASMLCVLLTIFVPVAAVSPNKKIVVILALVVGTLGATVVVPQIEEKFVEHVVLKSNEEGDVFYSRYAPWKQSYAAALQGGYFGLGYGVSAGNTDFTIGLTADTYGREKGNAQLAVWEETGLVGLALYSILLFAIFKELYRAFRAARDDDAKTKLAIILGMTAGLTAQSVFEAWWVAPGSLESAAFWSVVGVGTGLSRQVLAGHRRVAVNAVRANRGEAAVALLHGKRFRPLK
jgi:O-antigen ligase